MKKIFEPDCINATSLFDLGSVQTELERLVKGWREISSKEHQGRAKGRAKDRAKRNIAAYILEMSKILSKGVDHLIAVDCLRYLSLCIPANIRTECMGRALLGEDHIWSAIKKSDFNFGNPIAIARSTFTSYRQSPEYQTRCELMREDLSQIHGLRIAFDLEGVLVSTSYRMSGFDDPYVNLLRPGANEIVEQLAQDSSNTVWIWTAAGEGRIQHSKTDAGWVVPSRIKILGRYPGMEDFKNPSLFPEGDLDVLIEDNVSYHLEQIASYQSRRDSAIAADKMIQVEPFHPLTAKDLRSAHLDVVLFDLAKQLRERFSERVK